MIRSAKIVLFFAACTLSVICQTSNQRLQAQDETPFDSTTELRSDDKLNDNSRITELRILTYNIHAGRGLDGKLDLNRIAHVIRKTKPHLVALQEVDVNTRRSGKVDQAKKLAQLCNMKSGVRKSDRLSRWRIRKCRSFI